MRSITVRRLQRNFNKEILDLPVAIIRNNIIKGQKQTIDIVGVIYPYNGETIDTEESVDPIIHQMVKENGIEGEPINLLTDQANSIDETGYDSSSFSISIIKKLFKR